VAGAGRVFGFVPESIRVECADISGTLRASAAERHTAAVS
jgi:hypothetical protein